VYITWPRLEEIHMKTRTILLTLAVLLATVVVCFAADVTDVNMGTWKMNDAKSKLGPGAGKGIITAASDSVKVSRDGIDAAGKPWHEEWTGKFDGSKDYPVTGAQGVDTRAYKPVNDHTWAITEKKGGKIVDTGRVVYSAGGKARTVTATASSANGTKTTTTAVYDKQ
jgi:hypothetical protein